MRILFPIGSLYPSQEGGPSNTVYWMLKEFYKKGIPTTAVTSDKGINGQVELDKWMHGNYGEVIYCKVQFPFYQLAIVIRSFRLLKKHDIIHLTSLFYLPAILLAIISSFQNKKIIWSVRGTLEESAMQISPIRKKLVLKVINLLSKNIYFHSTSLLETENVRKYIKGDIKIYQIPNFIEMPIRHFKENNELFFLYIGRLHPIKGLENLLQALAINEDFLQSTFSLKIAGIGHPNYLIHLQNIIKEINLENKVTMLGQVEGSNKQQLYAEAYCTFMPSYSENFGNVVIESMCQGTPVVASTGSPWSQLQDNSIGYWVENDSQSLSNIITTLIKLPKNVYDDMRIKNFLFCKENYDVGIGIQRWIEAYNKILNTL